MAKQRIGSIRQKILVEGDPNLLNDNEILVIDNCGCGCTCDVTLKQLDSQHRIKAMVLMNADEYIRSLENAFKQGYAEGVDSPPAPVIPAPKPEPEPEPVQEKEEEKRDEPYIIGLD